MTRASLFVARYRGEPVAALTLSTRKPWAIDTAYFTPSETPLYLTDMAVDPRRQRKGLGRQCLAQAKEIAKRWPATALRLDAYDADFGAGDFYAKCGFCEVARAVYRQTPLIYFEILFPPGNCPPEKLTDALRKLEAEA
jgi:GNAT superfamily N-acetyltransferase